MEQLNWETVPQDHGGSLFRLKVPGGWLVRWTEEVCTTVGENDHRYPWVQGWEWRSSMCFVPDQAGNWLKETNAVIPVKQSEPALSPGEDPDFYTEPPIFDY